jgi:riboflavin-specific deaminase-like protein
LAEVATALDEAAAWALVRAAVPREVLEPGPRRVAHHTRPELWLELSESGGWEASAPPTPAARDLLDLYLPLTRGCDFVIGQLGQSLDGRIATVSGKSRYITGAEDIRHLHRLRALVDAVVVGANTVALDDPELTVREVEGENPVRVVLDPDGRLAQDLQVFSDGAARTLVVRRASTPTSPSWTPSDDPQAPEVLDLPTSGPAGFKPGAVLEALGARGLRRVLVEGGGVTVSRFLEAGLLDRLHLTVAPILMGSGRPGITLPPIETLDQSLRARCRHVPLGDDLLFDLDLR